MNGFRKFFVAVLFGLGSMFLCYTSHMTGGECVAALTFFAGLYKAANVIDKKMGGAG